MAFGQTKDMAVKFVNGTGLTISIPREGHRVKNPGGLEGWNNLTLGGSINNLEPGESRTVVQTLNVKADDDIQFEIHYGGDSDRDFTQLFTGKNTENKNTTLTLTRH